MTTNNFLYVQLQPFALAGGGAITGDTSIILTSMKDIDGNVITMAGTFGTKGFGTLDPGNGTLEEQISFTGLMNNTNGTTTLSGVSSVAFSYPYTETSGLAKTHAGATPFVISNTAGFYNEVVSKNDDAIITGQFQFPNDANTPTLGASYVAPTLQNQVASKGYADSLAITGAPNATTSVQGLVQLATQAQVDAKTATGSTGASLAPTPALARSTLLQDYVIDTGAADAYVITPSPAISAYTTGQIFTFKAIHANTTTSTLNVNGKGVQTIKKNGGANNLVAGDIIASQLVEVEYDGTNFQLISSTAEPKISQNGQEIYAVDAVGSDSYAITLVPAILAYTNGLLINFKAGTANTGPATLAVNGLTAIAIVKNGSSPLTTGDIVSGQTVQVEYDGTNFQLLSPTAGTPAGLVASGVTTYDISTTSGAQNIAHGLGVTPKIFNVCGSFAATNGFYTAQALNGNAVSGGTHDIGGGSFGVDASTTFNFVKTTGASAAAVITATSTNIVLTWTKTGSPTGTVNLAWSAEA